MVLRSNLPWFRPACCVPVLIPAVDSVGAPSSIEYAHKLQWNIGTGFCKRTQFFSCAFRANDIPHFDHVHVFALFCSHRLTLVSPTISLIRSYVSWLYHDGYLPLLELFARYAEFEKRGNRSKTLGKKSVKLFPTDCPVYFHTEREYFSLYIRLLFQSVGH